MKINEALDQIHEFYEQHLQPQESFQEREDVGDGKIDGKMLKMKNVGNEKMLGMEGVLRMKRCWK